MGEIVWGIDFTARKNAERAEAERNSHEVCQIAFEGGPTMEIPMSEVDAHFASEFGGRNSSMGGSEVKSFYLTRPRDELDDILFRAVEPPADCPA